METLLLLLAFPIIWPFVAKKIWGHEITWQELAINVVGIVVLVCGVYGAGMFSQTADTEVWNGQVVSKERVEGHYEESYDCFCTESCSGSGNSRSCYTTCQTCYEDHYTVDWFANVNYGLANERLYFQRLDRTTRRVYDTPDPASYSRCQAGDPASKEVGYTNYVQAVPQSLFSLDEGNADAYADRVPPYPRVHNFYRYNRVLDVGSAIATAELQKLNTLLNESLRTLGPRHQLNLIVIVTDIADPSFRYTVENAWLGGEKNDATVFIGTRGNEIIWADVMTFAHNGGNEMFHVTLRDALNDLGTFEAESVATTITSIADQKFDRIQMAEFEYLKDEISPPDWVIMLAAFLAIFGSIGLSFVMKVVDIGGTGGYHSFRRHRRVRFR